MTSAANRTSRPGLLRLLRSVGPGLVVAATGVGAGDLITAAKAGSSWGLPLLWTAVLGAVLKYVLAEGIARWQLATNTTVLEGWSRFLGRPLRLAFLLYLLLWTVVVAAALMSACGLAAHALFPQLSLAAWAVLHALLALAFVWLGGYEGFENIMKSVIAIMFVSILGSALWNRPDPGAVLQGLIPQIPSGSLLLVLGVIGGVGGTLTLLSYNYWMLEKGWNHPGWTRVVRVDLGVGYLLTGVFGAAVIVLAGQILHPSGVQIEGNHGVLNMAALLGNQFGRWGEITFLVGFWGAVASSLLGVWQSVPYLFFNALTPRQATSGQSMQISRHSWSYRGYLLFMTFPPMLLLSLGRPVWLVVAYAVLGALFMPFLAATLLFMNNRKSELGEMRNGLWSNVGLVFCILLFGVLGVAKIVDKVLH